MKRWFIIRHIRYFILRCKFEYWWEHIGQHLGAVPNQSDIDYLDKVWSGEL